MNKTDKFMRAITGYFLENLPRGLLSSFMPHEQITLDKNKMHALASRLAVPGSRREAQTGEALAAIGKEIGRCLQAFSGKAFLRLGSRSPKDTFYPTLSFTAVAEAFAILSFSVRAFQDVHWATLYDYNVSLFIRPWVDIKKWQEFRCIIKDGRLLGISQYYTQSGQAYPEIRQAAGKLAQTIHAFLEERVLPFAKHDSYVCDVLCRNDDISLIDYNLLTTKTGLCLFGERFPPSSSPEFRFRLDERIGSVALKNRGGEHA
jgi:hypothetical protein